MDSVRCDVKLGCILCCPEPVDKEKIQTTFFLPAGLLPAGLVLLSWTPFKSARQQYSPPVWCLTFLEVRVTTSICMVALLTLQVSWILVRACFYMNALHV